MGCIFHLARLVAFNVHLLNGSFIILVKLVSLQLMLLIFLTMSKFRLAYWILFNVDLDGALRQCGCNIDGFSFSLLAQ
jgi:hypothetical protein